MAYLAFRHESGRRFTETRRQRQPRLCNRKKSRKPDGKRQRRPKQRPASPEYLERAAQYYLARYASSVSNFKSVLQRKIKRRGLPDGVSDGEAQQWIEALTDRFVAVGLLDDAVYGRGKRDSLRRRGKSGRVIEAELRRKGLAAPLIETLLQEPGEAGVNPDIEAAINFARRKRLGPFARREPADPRREQQRALAAFARNGFAYSLARRILDAEDEAVLAAMLEDDPQR